MLDKTLQTTLTDQGAATLINRPKSNLMETGLVSGTRYTAVRLNQLEGVNFIDTATIGYTAEDVLRLAQEMDRDCGSEWAGDCPVVGIVEFQMDISQIHWR